jgi:hypothetical protein
MLLPDVDAPLLPPFEDGKPVGGAFMQTEPMDTPAPVPVPPLPVMPVDPASLPELYPIEPPVINQR